MSVWAFPRLPARSRWSAERFEVLGDTLTTGGNIPGFYIELDTGRPGPCVAVFGELDALVEDGAKRANKIVKSYQPDFASIPEYLAYADSFMLDRDAVKYDGKGNAILNLGIEEIDI